MQCDVLIYVEDPGAANYIMDLPASLDRSGVSTVLLAGGHAIDFLSKRGIAAIPVNEGKSAKEYVDHYRPFLIMVGTSENTETLGFDIIRYARETRKKTISWVDAYSNYQHRFRGKSNNPLEYVSDLLLVQDESTKKAFIGLGLNADKILVCGHPCYDKLLNLKKSLATIDVSAIKKKLFPVAYELEKPVVTFISETSTGLDEGQYKKSNEYTLHGWGNTKDRTGIVLEEFLACANNLSPRPYLVLRMHPKCSSLEFNNYIPNFDYISQNEDPLEVVSASDLVVGMASTLILESYLMGKKILSILPRHCEKDWLEIVKNGFVPCAETTEDIHKHMDNLLKSSPVEVEYNGFIVSDTLGKIVKIVKENL